MSALLNASVHARSASPAGVRGIAGSASDALERAVNRSANRRTAGAFAATCECLDTCAPARGVDIARQSSGASHTTWRRET